METILINNNHFYYSVEVKKRKSMQIKLIKPYTIIITTPNILNNDMVKNILLQKSSWLIKHNLNTESKLYSISTVINSDRRAYYEILDKTNGEYPIRDRKSVV